MFTYRKTGKEYSMSCFQAPEETLEDKHEMNIWACKAYAVALRASARRCAERHLVFVFTESHTNPARFSPGDQRWHMPHTYNIRRLDPERKHQVKFFTL